MVLRIFPATHTFVASMHCKIYSCLKPSTLYIFQLNYQQCFIFWKLFLHYSLADVLKWLSHESSSRIVKIFFNWFQNCGFVFIWKIVFLFFTAAFPHQINFFHQMLLFQKSSFEKIRCTFFFLDNITLIETELLQNLY